MRRKKPKPLWDGAIEKSAAEYIGGGALRACCQKDALYWIDKCIVHAFDKAYDAAFNEAAQVTEDNLWPSIQIKVTIKIEKQ